MTKEELLDNLVEYSALKKKYKQMCSVYQVEQKQTIAKFFALPVDIFYMIEYKEYQKLDNYFNYVLDIFYKHSEKFWSFYNLDPSVWDKIPTNLQLKAFVDWYKIQTGIKLDSYLYAKRRLRLKVGI